MDTIKKTCGQCANLKVCRYAPSILMALSASHIFPKGGAPFSWYDVANICKFYVQEAEEDSSSINGKGVI